MLTVPPCRPSGVQVFSPWDKSERVFWDEIAGDEADGGRQATKLVEMLLAFAEKNPGMVRVMTGDALVGEHERLQARMNQFYDRFEATLKQALRAPGEGPKASDADVGAHAGMLVRYVIGCLHQYAKSGFARKPTDSYAAQRRFLAACQRGPAGGRADSGPGDRSPNPLHAVPCLQGRHRL